MATNFLPIPNWTAWNNQGGGIAIADLNQDGRPDLGVLQIDNPDGVNQGLYRVGWNLDAAGNVTGGWSPWQTIPDWGSWDNQGGDLAIADLNNDGRPELIVFQIDNPAGENRGLYRIGWNLDVTGQVTGGWSAWMPVPNWGSWENQGGGIAIADLNGNGRPDLIVFQVDNPQGQNRGLYRIGWNLDTSGQVTGGWSDWMPVPDWYFWENQDAAIAVADLDGNGKAELIVFQIDNPPGANQGFYQIGWNLDGQTGRVTDGWSNWTAVPDWQSWENQGAGVAVVDLQGKGRSELVVFQIDNPPEANQGFYRVLDLPLDLDQALTQGVWRLCPESSQILAMHAAVLPGDRVFLFSGSSNNPNNLGTPFRSALWNYRDGSLVRPDTPADFFCSGHTFLPDGRLLVAGGTEEYDNNHPFHGLRDAFTFDPKTQQWQAVPFMAGGRWYPSLVTLGDGRVLAMSGLGEDGLLNLVPEIYTDATGATGWTALPSTATWAATPDTSTRRVPLYPHLFLLRDGRIFYTGGQYGANEGLNPCLLDLTQHTITEVGGLVGHDEQSHRNQSSSVLLPPAQAQRVMLIGGGAPNQNGNHHAAEAIANTNIIDFTAAQPAYTQAAPLNLGRMHLNAVLLPDRTVLVCGGSRLEESRPEATLTAELYQPTTNTWTIAAKARVPRLYHSVALLLPDGRVLTAGSNPARGDEEYRLEMYYPPYLFRGARPQIQAAPGTVKYGDDVTIQATAADTIAWVSLIRPMATTHSHDTEQRLVDLNFALLGSDRLKATIPNEPNLAPPGWYMLFVVDRRGVPSVAQWVHLVA